MERVKCSIELREVQRSIRRDEREFAITLVKEAGDAVVTERNDFRSVYCITKELACGRKSFEAHVKNLDARLLNYDNEQLQRWKEHFTMLLNRIRHGEVPPLLDEMGSERNTWIQAVPPSRREIISAINALKRFRYLSLHQLLIDFEKAFDSVNRECST